MATPIPFAGGRVSGANLSGFDWADADLAEAAFVDCLIEDVQFANTILNGARFTNCRIARCRAAHADLREALFEDCGFADGQTHTGLVVAFSELEQARFRNCDLSFSQFDRSGLHAVEMIDCNLRGARFHRADFSRSFGRNIVRTHASFRDCNLELAEMADIRLPGCDLSHCNLREADLSGADLEGADLRESDLFGTLLSAAKLAGADLRGAEVSGLNLLDLASRIGLKITADQQYRLLTALGVDVHVE
jgi:fluoroquinolone resistance protein